MKVLFTPHVHIQKSINIFRHPYTSIYITYINIILLFLRCINDDLLQVVLSLLQQIEQTPANTDKSPPKKKKPPSEPSPLESEDLFESTAAGLCAAILPVTQELHSSLQRNITCMLIQIQIHMVESNKPAAFHAL